MGINKGLLRKDLGGGGLEDLHLELPRFAQSPKVGHQSSHFFCEKYIFSVIVNNAYKEHPKK